MGILNGAGPGAWPRDSQAFTEEAVSLISKPLTMALSLSAAKLNVKLPTASAIKLKLASYARSFPPACCKTKLQDSTSATGGHAA